MNDQFFALPYDERRFISFISDETARDLAEVERQAGSIFQDLSKDISAADLIKRYLPMLAGITGARVPWVVSGVAVNALVGALTGAAFMSPAFVLLGGPVFGKQWRRLWMLVKTMRYRRAAEVGVKLVPISSAAMFELRSPRLGAIYVGHPAHPRRYLPITSFQRDIMREKFYELVRLLVYLGARDVRVENASVSEVGVDVGTGADNTTTSQDPKGKKRSARVGIGLGAGYEHRHDAEMQWIAHYEYRYPPVVPEGMLWFAAERDWQELARGRIEYRATGGFRLVVKVGDELKVGIDIKAKLTAAGFRLGVDVERQTQQDWHVSGTWWDKQDRVHK